MWFHTEIPKETVAAAAKPRPAKGRDECGGQLPDTPTPDTRGKKMSRNASLYCIFTF